MTFQNWIENIINGEEPSKDILAYYFGLFESENGYTMYLIGSTEYDKEDSDWACNNDYEPAEKYFPLSEEYKSLEWEEVLNKVCDLLKNFVETDLFKASFLSNAKAITTGFDDGDLILIK